MVPVPKNSFLPFLGIPASFSWEFPELFPGIKIWGITIAQHCVSVWRFPRKTFALGLFFSFITLAFTETPSSQIRFEIERVLASGRTFFIFGRICESHLLYTLTLFQHDWCLRLLSHRRFRLLPDSTINTYLSFPRKITGKFGMTFFLKFGLHYGGSPPAFLVPRKLLLYSNRNKNFNHNNFLLKSKHTSHSFWEKY